VEALTGVSQEEFVEDLNRWTRRGAIQILYALVACGLVSLLVWQGLGALRIFEVAVYLAVGFLVARSIEHRRRRFLLVYDLDDRGVAQFDQLQQALAEAAASGSLRAVRTVESIGRSARKYHGGAAYSIGVLPASLTRSPPPNVLTNANPYCLSTQGKRLYFLPDRVLILERGRFAALSYDELHVETESSPFQWTGWLPHDAQVVGHTWRYTNLDGGPDRRFANNPSIPLVLTGYLNLRSATGLYVSIQVTRPAAVSDVASAVAAILRCRLGGARAEVHAPGLPGPVRSALAALGLSDVPTLAQLKTLYRDLAIRNHPDRHAGGSADMRAFVEERMREINAAFELLKPLAAAKTSEPPTASTAEIEPRSEGAQPLPSRSAMVFRALVSEPYVRSPVLGLVVCAVLLVGFRQVEPGWTSQTTDHLSTHSPKPTTTESLAAAPTSRVTTETSRQRCPVRTAPEKGAKVLSWLPRGSRLDVLDRRSGWRRVHGDQGIDGWMGPFCWAAPHPAADVTPTAPEAGSSGTADSLSELKP